MVPPSPALQELLGLSPSQVVLKFSLLTTNDRQIPISYDVKYIPYEKKSPTVEKELRFAVLPDLALSKISTFSYYAEVAVRAVCADEEIARILQCKEGDALLLVEQTFIQHDGKKIAFARHYGRAEYTSLKGTSGHTI